MEANESTLREPVYLFDSPGYDVDHIRGLVRSAMAEMGIKPHGKVLVKPNTVAAHPVYFKHAFTRAEVLDGVVGALVETGGAGRESITLGERCGITIPTRFCFHYAKYGHVIRKHGIRRSYFEDERPVEVALRAEGRLRDRIFVPEPVADTDFLVNVPKFKTHPWTTVTFALKNFIGIQDDAHRLIDHDYRLEEKIADLQEVVRQRLIVIDAVIAGSGRMLTPAPVGMNMIIIGKNPVAVDSVCCSILGLDPAGIPHIRYCADRGLGPMDPARIEIRGDVSIEESRRRAADMKAELIRVEDFFADSPIEAVSGPPPNPEYTDYCWGGCPGAVEEAIDIIGQVQPGAKMTANRMKIVYGDMRGKKLDAGKGDNVVFLGDCCRFKGELFGCPVNVDSEYVARGQRNPMLAHSKDVFVRIAGIYWKWIVSLITRKKVLVVRGCPVSAAEHVLLLATIGGLKNPYFDRRLVFAFLQTWLRTLFVRLFRKLVGRLKPRLIEKREESL